MYTLDKLKSMSILLGNETVDGDLATYFINHIDHLSTMTMQKCIHDTGISKASIHRFYSKAGFINFKNFINVLREESKTLHFHSFHQYTTKVDNFIHHYDFSQFDSSSLFSSFKDANTIVIYANLREIYNLGSTISFLRSMNKKVIALNKWNIQSNYEVLESLKENDVFLIINTIMNIQNYYEMSINNDYLINLEKINDYHFHKYYLGQGNCDLFLDFSILKLPDYGEDVSVILINLLDKYICEKISKWRS